MKRETRRDHLTDQFGQGQLTIKLDTSDLGKQFGTLNKIGGMVTLGMILAGALVGLAIVTVAMLQPAIANTLGPLPGLAAFASSSSSSTPCSRSGVSSG